MVLVVTYLAVDSFLMVLMVLVILVVLVVLVVPEVKLESGPREMQMNLSSLTCAPGNTYFQASDYTYLTVAIHDMIHSFHCSVVLVVLVVLMATTNIGPGSIITIV